jgi:hypothetical protein
LPVSESTSEYSIILQVPTNLSICSLDRLGIFDFVRFCPYEVDDKASKNKNTTRIDVLFICQNLKSEVYVTLHGAGPIGHNAWVYEVADLRLFC